MYIQGRFTKTHESTSLCLDAWNDKMERDQQMVYK
jgi:hypothetical protein